MTNTSTRSSLISKHFVGEKLQSVCFLKQSRYANSHTNGTALPIVATGSWDSSVRLLLNININIFLNISLLIVYDCK